MERMTQSSSATCGAGDRIRHPYARFAMLAKLPRRPHQLGNARSGTRNVCLSGTRPGSFVVPFDQSVL